MGSIPAFFANWLPNQIKNQTENAVQTEKTEKLEQKTQKNEKQMNITKSDTKCFVS